MNCRTPAAEEMQMEPRWGLVPSILRHGTAGKGGVGGWADGKGGAVPASGRHNKSAYPCLQIDPQLQTHTPVHTHAQWGGALFLVEGVSEVLWHWLISVAHGQVPPCSVAGRPPAWTHVLSAHSTGSYALVWEGRCSSQSPELRESASPTQVSPKPAHLHFSSIRVPPGGCLL